ncbi:MAG: TRAP transporter large permease [Beijerinckiaceae bacterium]
MGGMSPNAIGIAGLVALLVLILLRFPIGLALAIVSISGLSAIIGFESTYNLLTAMPYEFAANWELSAIPMFLLMGAIAFHSGMTADLYAAARVWLRGMPGGLAVATNFACAGFAAASGSSVATTVAMGRIAIPEMLRAGYDKSLAAGTVACSGTLGSLIPPSVLMIVYAIFTAQSVGDLFLAGFLPGILTAAVYGGMIVIRCKLDPSLAPQDRDTASIREKFVLLLRIWPLPLLIVGVIGSIYGGVATPTEAAALGVIVATVIAWSRGQLSYGILKSSLLESMEATASIFFVAIGAMMLTRFLLFSGVPDLLSGLVKAWSINLLTLLVIVTFIYLVLGCFLEPIGLMLITLPIVLPAMQPYDVNLIWFGIMLIKYVEIGLMTPPVGMNAYAVKVIAGDAIPIETIFRGIVWFLVCELIVIALLIAFPSIVLVVPGLSWSPKLF